MTAHTVAAGGVAKHRFVLAAGVEDTVNFADDADQLEVLCFTATEPVFFTVDGTAAAVDGASSYVVTANSSMAVDRPRQATAGPVVRLISAAAATVSVMRA